MTARWHEPTDLDAAVGLLRDDAVIVAGGVSVVLFMNLGFLRPDHLVSLARIDDLRGVHQHDDELIIGAMETHDRLSRDPAIRSLSPATAAMFSSVGNPRVRNAGTIGGNLAHADPAQDPPVMLSVLDAQVDVVGPDRHRTLHVQDVADGPLSTAIGDDEIITRVRIPTPPATTRTAYVKFRPGTLDDYATVSVAAALEVADDETVRHARLAAGSVGPTSLPLARAAAVLEGQRPEPDVLEALHAAVRDEVRPSSDRRGSADYKREMAGVVARRAVEACERGDQPAAFSR